MFLIPGRELIFLVDYYPFGAFILVSTNLQFSILVCNSVIVPPKTYPMFQKENLEIIKTSFRSSSDGIDSYFKQFV